MAAHSLDSEYAARAVTEWIRSCDKRQAKLISYVWFTVDHRQHRVVSDMVGLQVGTVSNFLDAQKANHSVSQRCRSRGYFTGCRRMPARNFWYCKLHALAPRPTHSTFATETVRRTLFQTSQQTTIRPRRLIRIHVLAMLTSHAHLFLF